MLFKAYLNKGFKRHFDLNSYSCDQSFKKALLSYISTIASYWQENCLPTYPCLGSTRLCLGRFVVCTCSSKCTFKEAPRGWGTSRYLTWVCCRKKEKLNANANANVPCRENVCDAVRRVHPRFGENSPFLGADSTFSLCYVVVKVGLGLLWFQFDQMARLFFIIWQVATDHTYPILIKNCQSRFKILPSTK